MTDLMVDLRAWARDFCSAAARSELLARVDALMSRAMALDAAAWHRLDLAARRVAVVEAMRHIPDDEPWGVRAACAGVLAWLADGAPEGRRGAVRDATWTAWAAADAAGWAAWAAAYAAGLAALAAAAVSAAVYAAAAYTAAAAWDRMVAAVLDAIEAECNRVEPAA